MTWRPKVGDAIETKIGKKWARVIVEDCRLWDGEDVWMVRRERHHTDPLCPRMSRWIEQLRPVSVQPSHDPLSAGVYADWLEEHDFPEAATALRRAFPFAEEVPLGR